MTDRQIAEAAQSLWDYHCIFDDPVRSDVIIGLGSYDLRVADRCAELFHNTMANQILFTGDRGHWTRDLFDHSEARIFAQRAIQNGIPEKAIILEERATNIGENITLSAKIVGATASAILVTKPQTQRRCFATSKKQWPTARTLVTAPLHGMAKQPIAGFGNRHLICEMVGDLYRIQAYPDAGYQIAQDIPKPVLAAQQFLIERGFTDHL